MSTAVRTERTYKASPRFTARLAGALYLIAVLTAVLGEFIVPGRLGIAAAVVIPISCYAVVTLLLYAIFRLMSNGLALLMALFGLVGLACEALRLHPGGVTIGMVFHGLYCLLLGWLIFRSIFLPRILGVLMALAGIVWLIYLSPSLASRLAPYNSVVGLLCEAAPMLWLLVMGVDAQRWKEQSQ